ncbi:NAD-dependent epimerase/dehydratase family protein [Methylocaldum sp. GT1BB]|uniref:NAD-dependent epimerase/dehydratase family protein n=1 Tax=Methylocaldum sp. GT1BB TaxID=3438963 RepID=UPI003DA00569
MRILLTGASGFIGHRLVKLLISRGVSIVSLGRRPCDIPHTESIVLPALEPERIEYAVHNCSFDAVIHLAAAGVHPSDRGSLSLMQINSLLPGVMVSVAAKTGAKAIILAGSSAEYRSPHIAAPLMEESPLETGKLYGASKAAGGMLALAQGAVHDIPVGVVRLFNVYGPGEAPHRLLPSLLRNLTANQPVELSAGTQIRDFVYIDDACSGLISTLEAVIEKRLASGAYNLATGVGHTVSDFSRTVARVLKADESLLKFGALPLRPDDLPYVVGDSSILKNVCGWCPKYNMEDGIGATIKELRSIIYT